MPDQGANNDPERAPGTEPGPNFADSLQALGRDFSIYSVQAVALRLGQFLLLPLYLAYLTPEDFGILALATVYGALVSAFIGFGLDTAVLRFFFEWPARERPRRLGSVWIFAITGAFVLTVIFDAVGRRAGAVLIHQISYDPYLRLMLWTVFFMGFEAIPVAVLRCRQESRRYAAITILTFVFRELLKLYALVERRGALGVLEWSLYGAAVSALFYTIYMILRVQLWPKLAHVRGPLRFSLPRIPGAAIETVSVVLDRIILDKFVSIEQLGGYEVARRLGNVVRDVNTPLKTAWVPFAFRLAVERRDAPRHLARASSYYVALLLTIGLGVALISRELLVLFGQGQYAAVHVYVPVFAVLFTIDGAFTLLGTNMYISKKTFQGSLVTATSAAVLLVGSLVFIQRFGFPGVFLGGLLHRVVHGTLLFRLANTYFPVEFEWKRIGLMALTAATTYALGAAIVGVSLWVSLALKAGLMLTYVALAGFGILDGRTALAILTRKRGRVAPAQEGAPVERRSSRE